MAIAWRGASGRAFVSNRLVRTNGVASLNRTAGFGRVAGGPRWAVPGRSETVTGHSASLSRNAA
jgi:hypothetical protein